jgi:hypothetical protein
LIAQTPGSPPWGLAERTSKTTGRPEEAVAASFALVPAVAGLEGLKDTD